MEKTVNIKETPIEVAKLMVCMLGDRRFKCVGDTSAGYGRLLKTYVDSLDPDKDYGDLIVWGIEYNTDVFEILREASLTGGYISIYHNCFSLVNYSIDFIDMFDCLILNPPFETDLIIHHIVYNYRYLLQPGGVLITVIPKYILKDKVKKVRIRFNRWLARRVTAIEYPGKMYDPGATDCPEDLYILKLEKPLVETIDISSI